MADRKSLLSRFWPASGPRRTSATQTTALSPTTTNSPPKAETQTPVSRSTTKARNPISSTTPPSRNQIDDQPKSTSPEPRKSPPSQMQTTSQTIATTSNPINDPKTTSPSRGITQSLSSSKPASPNARLTQSRSPPQPSSTPKRTSQPNSPSRLNSRSPKSSSPSPSKRTQPTSPSKKSTQPNQEISSSHDAHIFASNEEVPKLVTSQQEPQTKVDVKFDTDHDVNGQTMNGTSFNHKDEELTPSQSSEVGKEKLVPSKSLDSPTITDKHEPSVGLKAKLEETKDVKEVMQATSTEANEETKKEVDDPLTSNSASKAQILRQAELPTTPEQLHTEKQEALHTKEVLAASVTQRNKRSTISGTHSKSDVPNGEHVPLHKNIRDNTLTLVDKMAVGNHQGTIHDRPVSVITLAGENRGASMQMESSSSKREGLVHIHRGYKTNPDESVEAITDGDGSSKRKKSEDANFEDQPTEAYVNNNAQGINNSIVFNSSVSEGNPGVHMIVTHVPKETSQSTDIANPTDTRKAEFNATRMEKLTYQPTVRRRCLRGLLLEMSDSDPDKPRSHGCRVGCQKRDEENYVDDL